MSYDDSGRLLDRMEKRGIDGEWVNDRRSSQAYDAMGRRTELVLMNWINGTWDNDERIAAAYDDASRERRPTSVRLTILDLLGRVVDVLVDEQLPAGRHETTWSADGLSGGIYFFRLEAGDVTNTGKLIIAR